MTTVSYIRVMMILSVLLFLDAKVVGSLIVFVKLCYNCALEIENIFQNWNLSV